ncbi:serine/threonine-protein kinase [Dulcicalothrix desertica]|nr:serine/threonine-protein kinase [Dulcicalothrix desertica]TWH61060.1 serine/threonine protein kinase [Dulcicalothrix desertica PCC 7102]
MQYQPEHSPGDMIYGRYKIISFISRGGFGETYKAEDKQQQGLICLLKYLKPLTTNSSSLRIAQEKFCQEASTLRRLGTHSQIPELYDYFEENQKFYLVEEYIDGQNLADELKNSVFSEIQVIQVLYDTLKILDYLYQNNVIHRDIKPANLVRRNCDKKNFLVDFGAVKEISILTIDSYTETISTMVVGTLKYIPPEQAEGQANFASDIYALGITALELLTKKIPHGTQEVESLLNELEINPNLAKILQKMVRFNYKERYQTPLNILFDLQPLILLGQTLNQRYKITKYLGGGDFYYTYLAEDLKYPFQSDCIIKQLQLNVNNQYVLQEAQSRFTDILNLLDKLSHEQVPQLFDDFEYNKEFYLVYKFIPGESISEQLTKENCWSEAQVIALLKDVLKVLSFMHRQGIIHGDIKPSNLIRRQQDGKICLIYLAAPEQLSNKKKLQPASDIYALGMTAIQALTGVHPQELKVDLHGEVSWKNLCNVSPNLALILDKMVRCQTEKRYQSAQKVLDDLNTQVSWAKIEKYWRLIAMSTIAISFSIVYYIYSGVQEQQAVHYFNQGTEKILSGDNHKKTGDIEKANKYYNEAIAAFEKATQINPKFTEAWVNQGYAYGQRRKFAEQAHACIQAHTINSNSPLVWICIGNVQFAAKQYEDSIKRFTQATQTCNSQLESKKNTCVAAWSNIGDAYLALNKPEQALNAFNKALRVKKDFQQAINGKTEAQKHL